MSIDPDANDWTWVVERSCPECDFDASALMLTQEDPLFPNRDQDAAAIRGRYGEQDPGSVAVDLQRCAEDLAAAFGCVRAEQWQRTGRRSNGSVFTVETPARYFVHDPVHHLHDVGG